MNFSVLCMQTTFKTKNYASFVSEVLYNSFCLGRWDEWVGQLTYYTDIDMSLFWSTLVSVRGRGAYSLAEGDRVAASNCLT